MAMVTEQVCTKKSTRCLKIPLNSTEQIYLVFLIPAVLSCCIYMLHFAADLVVAVQHFRADNPIWGSCTIALMYAPAVAYFILTVSRPDWWMTEDQKVSQGVVRWFAMQLCQLVAFPIFALYRFAGQIVVIVDAILLSGEERNKSLSIAAAPAAIELYFFLQAWFQAAPQAVFQIHLLFLGNTDEYIEGYTEERTYQTVVVHVLCILVSIIILAIQTTYFQRFESQRVNGRKLPWALWLKKYRVQELGNLEENKPLKHGANIISKQQNPNSKSASNVESSQDPPSNPSSPQQLELGRVTLERQISATPPLPPKNAQMIPPPAPLRGITSVTPLPVPEMQAPPRPDSIIKDTPDNDNETTGKSTENIVNQDVNQEQSSGNFFKDLKLPKRMYSIKGLEDDDPIGKIVSFFWWFFFISARVFAIALFFKFYPIWLVAIIGVHYILMLTYLFYYAKDFNITTFIVNLWLGFVYIISLIEYRVKFKYAEKWILFYYLFVILQNTIMTVTWFTLDVWQGFWYSYMFYAIFISMGLCILSTTVYYVLLKPGIRRIYAS